ncbi:MAG: hypothetical protein VYD66_07175, partial [Candidatus Neomarinimicrobiota bacterium]|nr:hypothetical protein [Candidatus Neomarinimicrobiota bacterium]
NDVYLFIPGLMDKKRNIQHRNTNIVNATELRSIYLKSNPNVNNDVLQKSLPSSGKAFHDFCIIEVT